MKAWTNQALNLLVTCTSFYSLPPVTTPERSNSHAGLDIFLDNQRTQSSVLFHEILHLAFNNSELRFPKIQFFSLPARSKEKSLIFTLILHIVFGDQELGAGNERYYFEGCNNLRRDDASNTVNNPDAVALYAYG